MGAHRSLPAPVGHGGGNDQFLTEDAAREAGQVGEQAGVVQHTGSERVRDGDATVARDLHQAGYPQPRVAPQVERVAHRRGHVAQHHVDRFELVQGAHPQPAILDDEVLPFHQRVAEHRGEVGLVEGGTGVRARGEQHGPRGGPGVFGGKGGDGAADRVEERPDPADARVPVETGEHLGGDAPVLHREAHPGGHLGAVGDDLPGAVGIASEVGAEQEELVGPGVGDAGDGAEEPRVPEDEGRGDRAVGKQGGLVIQIHHDRVEQASPLLQAAFDRGPLDLVEKHRKRIEEPGAVVLAFADPHAVVGEQGLDFERPLGQLLAIAQSGEVGHLSPGFPGSPRGLEHLVVSGPGSAITREQVSHASPAISPKKTPTGWSRPPPTPRAT